MTIDEQTIILDLMQKNGFAPVNSNADRLDFQKVENDESVQITFVYEFPYYVRIKYAHAHTPDKWAQKTLMLKSFAAAETFAKNGAGEVVDNLKQEFNKKLRRAGSEIVI